MKEIVEEEILIHGKKNQIEKFECEVCSRDFVSKHALVIHKTQTDGEVYIYLPICGEMLSTQMTMEAYVEFKHNTSSLKRTMSEMKGTHGF